jgi:hypothetical protein
MDYKIVVVPKHAGAARILSEALSVFSGDSGTRSRRSTEHRCRSLLKPLAVRPGDSRGWRGDREPAGKTCDLRRFHITYFARFGAKEV